MLETIEVFYLFFFVKQYYHIPVDCL